MARILLDFFLVLGLFLGGGFTLTSCSRGQFELGGVEITTHRLAFWPPDMVPYPHPAHPPPKDDDMA